MVDGVLAPRRKATLAYEARVRAGVDPGLAQVTRTNAFRTQVFPIFPDKGRTIRLSFVTPLVAGQNFALPLNTAEPIKALSLHVRVSGRQTPPRLVGPDGFNLHWTPTTAGFEARVQASNVSLSGAIEIEPPAAPPTVSMTRHKNGDVFFEINDVAPALNDRALNPRRLRVYWDHSLSRRDDNLALEREFLRRYVETVSPGIVDLVFFSDHGPELQTLEAPSMGERLDDVLRTVTYAGATSLEDVVDAPLPTAEACFFFSDGTVSIDSYTVERVHCPIFAVSTAADADRGFLSVLAKRSAGAYFDLAALGIDAVLGRLTGKSPRVVSVTTPEGRAIDYAVLPAEAEHFRIVGPAPVSGDIVVTLASGTKRIRAYATSRKASIPMHDAMGALWAADRAAELGATDRPDTDAIVALSRRYSVTTDAAVFIVLETGYDYAYAGIEPPPSIGERELAHYRQTVAAYQNDKRKEQGERLDDVIKRWAREKRWWRTDFSKPLPPDIEDYDGLPDTVLITGSLVRGRPGDASDITISIEPWNPDRPYLAALDTAAPDDFMSVYREQEAAFGSLPAFYLDVAEYLYRHDRADDAIDVALNALELPTANTATMSILAERLLKYGEERRALWLLERIAYLEPDRPQPLRALALALMQRADRKEGIPIVAAARRKDYSRALDLLNEIVTRTWDGYNDELDLVALMEANRIIPRLSQLGVTKVPLDPRLVAPLDVDLRAVLEWDTDASDVDLWIDEPNGTRAKWSRSRTSIGGRINNHTSWGYGPEEYLLRRAPAGTYAVRVDVWWSDSLNPNGPINVRVHLFRDYNRATEAVETLELELKRKPALPGEGENNYLVGTFTVSPAMHMALE
jgi:tetratricopeptide (TPR) repeat protein